MKKKKVLDKIEKHLKEKLYVRLTRRKGGFEGITTGFILDKSDQLVLIQESDEFRILGYQIIPIDTIKHVRYNKNDKTYERILHEEGLMSKVESKYQIDLTNWNTACEGVMKTGLTVISEGEHPRKDIFCIGEIKSVNKRSVSIRYFNAQGILDKENTKHKFKDITKLSFDDHYANVFSKYAVEKTAAKTEKK